MKTLPPIDGPWTGVRTRQAEFERELDGLRRTIALRVALESGAMQALTEGPATGDELAERLAVNGEGLARFLDAVVSLGLLLKQDGRYALRPGDEVLFGPGGPYRAEQRGNMAVELGRYGGALEALRATRRDVGVGSGGTAPLPVRMRFHRMLAERSRPADAQLAAWLATEPARRIVDLGCGSGIYGLALASAMPGAELTLVDLPEGEPVARAFADERGVAARYLAADVERDDLGGPYDLAVLANVLHLFDEERARAVLRRATASLAPGGRLVVKEIPVEPDGTAPVHGALFGVLMAIWAHGGRAWPVQTVSVWMTESGLIVGEPVALDGLEASYAVVGTKA